MPLLSEERSPNVSAVPRSGIPPLRSEVMRAGACVWKQLDRRACLRFRFRETITSVWLDGSRTTISQREIRMYSNIRNSSKVPQKKPQKLHETGCFPTKMRLSRMDCATTTQSWNSVSFSQGWSREAPWDTFWQDAISWRRGGPSSKICCLRQS